MKKLNKIIRELENKNKGFGNSQMRIKDPQILEKEENFQMNQLKIHEWRNTNLQIKKVIIHKSKSIALLRPVKMSENNSTLMLNFFKWWVAPHSFSYSSRKERCVEPHSTGHWTRSLMGSKILFAIFDGLYLIAASLLLCLALHTKCYSFDAETPIETFRLRHYDVLIWYLRTNMN